jgi:hypothetical protein
MSLDDSILFRLADPSEDETQEDVNEKSLLQHDKAELLSLIANPDISKYELDFYYEIIDDSDNEYWNYVLMEIIKVYSLNTLKMFSDNSITTEARANEIKKLLKYLKVRLPEMIADKTYPLNDRILSIKKLEENDAPKMLIFAIETISTQDYEKFCNYIY